MSVEGNMLLQDVFLSHQDKDASMFATTIAGTPHDTSQKFLSAPISPQAWRRSLVIRTHRSEGVF